MQTESNSASPQPLTFGGVAGFAYGPRGRLWLYQWATALLAGAALAVLFELAWVPVIRRTIAALPTTGEIRAGQLDWQGAAPVRAVGNSFLWISIDPANALEPGEGADLQVEFGAAEVEFRSLLGYLYLPYPKGYRVALNRTILEPWWGAWRPAVTGGIVGLTVFWLFVVWTALAWIYAWPARLIAFYADRQLTWLGAWRLAAGCLLPGALFFSIAVAAYAVQRIDLVQLLAAAVLHLMVGWVYLLFSPFALPRVVSGAKRKNPFQSGKPKKKNPFAGSGR